MKNIIKINIIKIYIIYINLLSIGYNIREKWSFKKINLKVYYIGYSWVY